RIMKRFFESQELQPYLISGESCELSARNFHYLKHVLRLQVGDLIALFDGSGQDFVARLTDVRKQSIQADLEKATPSPAKESPLETHLGIVISKGDRFDYALQKATELGVHRITPLTSEFGDVRFKAERLNKKEQHWQDVIISACEQSGRGYVPQLQPTIVIDQWLAERTETIKWVCHTRHTASQKAQGSNPIEDQSRQQLAILIGPEGGLSDSEVQSAEQQGFILQQFGHRILRTETAPIVVLSAAQLLFGDFTVSH
ncbi:MAG: 16S rRNA (uracil(1498)-N(3))-methyltransferase, partial [Pseudomonadota bacterium]|nr:16S rRNA (uracil(1498)-N(3))-methyltransferase [Pseudomonadota bacterium]